MKNWSKAGVLAAVAFGLTAAALMVRPPVAEVQDQSIDSFVGTYRLAGSASSAEQSIEAALERGVENVNFAIRGLALSRLKAKNPLIRTIKIESRSGKVKVTFDGSRSYESPADGSLQNQRDVTGDRVRVGARLSRGRLQQIFVSDSGRRVNSYSLNGNTLRLGVRVTADILPDAVTYSVNYTKQ